MLRLFLLLELSVCIFGASDEKSGAVENGVRLYNDPSCHHIPEVYGGINAAKATVLLRDFFRVRR